jgi:hypothetical protein
MWIFDLESCCLNPDYFRRNHNRVIIEFVDDLVKHQILKVVDKGPNFKIEYAFGPMYDPVIRLIHSLTDVSDSYPLPRQEVTRLTAKGFAELWKTVGDLDLFQHE